MKLSSKDYFHNSKEMNKVLSLAYFAGGSKFTIEPFKALKDSKHKLKIVYTKEPKKAGRGKKKKQNSLFEEIIKNNISIKTLHDFKNLENIKLLKELKLDFIIVFSCVMRIFNRSLAI